MPYFEGPVNAASLALTDSLNQVVYGVSAADAKVMHTPERVIRSQDTGLAPLDGRTFEDIAASPYAATYLDEVTHLHWWFYPGESCTPDQGYRHKVHRINGVYCFVINDREDQAKFGNQDGGVPLDTRYSLLQKALYGNSSEIVVVFDDWEALAGKSFDPVAGRERAEQQPEPVPQHHPLARQPPVGAHLEPEGPARAGRWPTRRRSWSTTARATTCRIQTYEWLKHAARGLVPLLVLRLERRLRRQRAELLRPRAGDHRRAGRLPRARRDAGAGRAAAAERHEARRPEHARHARCTRRGTRCRAAPAGRLRDLGVASYLAMIYETAWHEEDEADYTDSNCYGAWLYPDDTWDGVNTWALRLQNHVRGVGPVRRRGAVGGQRAHRRCSAPPPSRGAPDLDLDGEAEYVIRNATGFAVFERYGGRCVLAVRLRRHAATRPRCVVGAPVHEPLRARRGGVHRRRPPTAARRSRR